MPHITTVGCKKKRKHKCVMWINGVKAKATAKTRQKALDKCFRKLNSPRWFRFYKT